MSELRYSEENRVAGNSPNITGKILKGVTSNRRRVRPLEERADNNGSGHEPVQPPRAKKKGDVYFLLLECLQFHVVLSHQILSPLKVVRRGCLSNTNSIPSRR